MGIKLVIADDAPFIRDVLKNILASSEIELVGEAQDGAQAVAVVKATKPDVVLMDIVMPNKSGIEATEEILSELPQIKIIAFSTVDQETMVMRALEAGCCDYIVKPFQAEQILHSIRSAAGRQL